MLPRLPTDLLVGIRIDTTGALIGILIVIIILTYTEQINTTYTKHRNIIITTKYSLQNTHIITSSTPAPFTSYC